MSKYDLHGKRVALVATDGFEPSELTSPLAALRQSGADVRILSIKSGGIRAKGGEPTVPVNGLVTDATESDFDALVLPGGVANPDTLRQDDAAVNFVKKFFLSGKPVAAICHGPQVLIEAEVVKGRKMTSYASVRTDLENAGAEWVDEAVVVDQGLVTSRSPADLDAFNDKMLEEIAEGVHAKQRERTEKALGAKPNSQTSKTKGSEMLHTLDDLLVHEIQDLYSAESQLIEALPKMAGAAHDDELQEAFREHLRETKDHVDRLAEAAKILGVSPTGETCEAMKGLIREGAERVEQLAEPTVKDAALISAAQRVEHYEIAGYGSAACFAHCTDNKDVQKLLEQTLAEEKDADSKLSKLAQGGRFSKGLNQEAPMRG
jgi:protease I